MITFSSFEQDPVFLEEDVKSEGVVTVGWKGEGKRPLHWVNS